MTCRQSNVLVPHLQQLVTACTVLQAVVNANSQSNGDCQIMTRWGSETPERISMKLWLYTMRHN